MEILPLLIGISVVVVIAVAGIFVWAVRSGQFDDLDTPAVRILADDDEPSRHDRGHHGVAEEAARSTEDGHSSGHASKAAVSSTDPHRGLDPDHFVPRHAADKLGAAPGSEQNHAGGRR